MSRWKSVVSNLIVQTNMEVVPLKIGKLSQILWIMTTNREVSSVKTKSRECLTGLWKQKPKLSWLYKEFKLDCTNKYQSSPSQKRGIQQYWSCRSLGQYNLKNMGDVQPYCAGIRPHKCDHNKTVSWNQTFAQPDWHN